MAEGTSEGEVRFRWDLRPGDLGAVLRLHGLLYAREFGFDYTFEGYVAETLAHFSSLIDPARERFWLAEVPDCLVGSIAVITRSEAVAQLRWLLVDPAFRGRGIGGRLVREVVTFARGAGYRSIFLETLKELTSAAALYRSAGFELTSEKKCLLWGRELTDQRYDLRLAE